MQVYKQTAKALDVLLSREQRLVYSLCREEISDVVLAQRANLPLDFLQSILIHLLEQNLIEVVVGTPNAPTAEPKATDPLATTKAQLMAALEAELGEKAKKYQAEVEGKQSLSELEEWSLKLVLKLRLTISQKAADALEARVKALFK
ncbi:MAG: hypothetical protein KatS3mg074_551 [Meiothermus sp.]|uniref:Uncharacterized protein n=2 Tax=Meiothermus hypogaeus TaxID=884155 RepID=A0A511QXP2_9DEIN|nr:hypothetical protein [Meiothermus hypogaeus]RIH79076.1 hypothetical protein Mhypo_01241 [Meiothermus hypogaeus]GEM82149.1 hypothetical protein MHY01S_03150 [Meiothermus hypogaeus NBRC 106114]GIW38153.1 MAG: hypothetical protein KatS3mg074_551 [Meiothermus sp.]